MFKRKNVKQCKKHKMKKMKKKIRGEALLPYIANSIYQEMFKKSLQNERWLK